MRITNGRILFDRGGVIDRKMIVQIRFGNIGNEICISRHLDGDEYDSAAIAVMLHELANRLDDQSPDF